MSFSTHVRQWWWQQGVFIAMSDGMISEHEMHLRGSSLRGSGTDTGLCSGLGLACS